MAFSVRGDSLRLRFLAAAKERASPCADLVWHSWGLDLQGCSEEETQGKLCPLDLFLWCHSAFVSVSGALNEPKSVCAWSDGHLGPRGGQPLSCQWSPQYLQSGNMLIFLYEMPEQPNVEISEIVLHSKR